MGKRRKRDLPDDDDLRVARRGSTFLLRLHDREVQVLQWVFADLERLLEEGAGSDPVTQRLFPRAYLDPTEERAESEWQSLAHGDLVASRRSALGITADDVLEDLDPDDPRAEGYAVYDWLTHLLAALLGAVSEPGDESVI